MNIIVITAMLFQSVFSVALPVEKVSYLEINCVGRCRVHNDVGSEIMVKVIAPDSMKDKFGIKRNGNEVVCGLVESIKNDSGSGIDDISGFWKSLKDSIEIDVGLPESLLADTVSINAGVANLNAGFTEYSISLLELNAGAGYVSIHLKGKNGKEGGRMEINVGAGSVNIKGAENFLADTMEINAGMATVALDFDSKPEVTPLYIYISSAMSGFTMVLPDNVLCQKGHVESFLSLKSLSACNSTEGDIVLNIEGALSSIDVIKKEGVR